MESHFNLEEIKAAHAKVKSGADFPRYIQDLIKLGITYYETFVSDGHTVYFGTDNYEVASTAKYQQLAIARRANCEQFIILLKAHQQGKTDYLTFCNDAAKSGVEKWAVSMDKMTCTYFDKAGNEMLVETVRTPETPSR